MGWNVKPTQKGADSVIVGIDVLKRHKLFVTPRSSNLIKELQNYKWVEDKNGNLLQQTHRRIQPRHRCAAIRNV
jgi:phage terminase large subunit